MPRHPPAVCGNKAILGGGPGHAPAGAVTVPAGNDSAVNWSRARHAPTGSLPACTRSGRAVHADHPGLGRRPSSALPVRCWTGSTQLLRLRRRRDQRDDQLSDDRELRHRGRQPEPGRGQPGLGGRLDDRPLHHRRTTPAPGRDARQRQHAVVRLPAGQPAVRFQRLLTVRAGPTWCSTTTRSAATTPTTGKRTSPAAAAPGGGKFWDVNGAVDHRQLGARQPQRRAVGGHQTTAASRSRGNYIADNYRYGLIYEISYNALIKDNMFVRNGLATGPTNQGFPIERHLHVRVGLRQPGARQVRHNRSRSPGTRS